MDYAGGPRNPVRRRSAPRGKDVRAGLWDRFCGPVPGCLRVPPRLFAISGTGVLRPWGEEASGVGSSFAPRGSAADRRRTLALRPRAVRPACRAPHPRRKSFRDGPFVPSPRRQRIWRLASADGCGRTRHVRIGPPGATSRVEPGASVAQRSDIVRACTGTPRVGEGSRARPPPVAHVGARAGTVRLRSGWAPAPGSGPGSCRYAGPLAAEAGGAALDRSGW